MDEALVESVRSRAIEMMRSRESGVTSSELETHFSSSGEELQALAKVLSEMFGVNRIEVLRQVDGGNETTYKLRDDEEAAKVSVLTNEQLVVWQVVTKAGNSGVWLRDIKNATSLQQQTLNKALKVLETRKLVKTVKSVQQKTKKLFMAYDLEPTREVSGGPWYTDQEFDHDFVATMKKLILRFIQEKSIASIDEIAQALMNLRVTHVKLEPLDVRLVVQSLVSDLKLEEVDQRGEASSARYKIFKPCTTQNYLTQIPCGSCPLKSDCSPNGLVSPKNCVYIDSWLKASRSHLENGSADSLVKAEHDRNNITHKKKPRISPPELF